MSKKAARQKQRQARALLQQSRLALQAAVFETDVTAKVAALRKAEDLAISAQKASNQAAEMIR